jgi:hypothetical protein
MNSLQSKRTHIHRSSVAAAALLIGLFTAGQAAAQSSGPVAVDPTHAKAGRNDKAWPSGTRSVQRVHVRGARRYTLPPAACLHS